MTSKLNYHSLDNFEAQVGVISLQDPKSKIWMLARLELSFHHISPASSSNLFLSFVVFYLSKFCYSILYTCVGGAGER